MPTLSEQYEDGRECGRRALLARGGTRGAEWYADNRDLVGAERDEFVLGFNEALDEEGVESES